MTPPVAQYERHYTVYKQWDNGVPIPFARNLSEAQATQLAKRQVQEWALCNCHPRIFTTYRDGSIGWDSKQSKAVPA